jgi:type III pantothenate kinase
MLLTIDIGNSNILFGIFKGDKLVEKHKIPTEIVHSFRKCNSIVYGLSHRKKIDRIIISSVVPEAAKCLVKPLKRIFGRDVMVMGKDIKAPIKNLYGKPEQVGQDRLVNSAAAAAFYNKGKKSPVVVIDFGTALTFDVISKKNEYLGGVIFPGLKLSLENLTRRAALLPKVTIKRPGSLIGKNTKDSMRSGILYGYAALCDGLIKQISASMKGRLKVVATGGDAALIASCSKYIRKVDPDLTLKGLKIIADTHKKGKC